MLKTIIVALALSSIAAASAQAQQAKADPAQADPAKVDRVIKETFKSAPAAWQARIVPDETQRICSQVRGQPSAEQEKTIVAAAQASLAFPADGNLLGDWKRGEQLAQRGTGGQFSDNDQTPKGGNCYACHQMAAAEVSYGTLGPSLHNYGKIRKYAKEDAKAAYAKVYNPQATQACSNMPRFGQSKFLSEQDIKDLTAYLFDPASPVNQ